MRGVGWPPVWTALVRCVAVLAVVTATGALGVSQAFASAPWWSVGSQVVPATLPAGGEGQIVIRATNVGDEAVQGEISPVSISEVLPAGLEAVAIKGFSGDFPEESEVGFPPHNFGKVSCVLSSLSCSYAGTLPPYNALVVELTVRDEGARSGEADRVSVAGGGAPGASHTQPVAVGGAPASFGVEGYALSAEEEGGSQEVQAGSHPFQLTSSFAINTTLTEGIQSAIALPKDLSFRLPAGLVGDAGAFPQCTEAQYFDASERFNHCPADTAVGVVSLTLDIPSGPGIERTGGFEDRPRVFVVPVFNMVPAPGEPARLGFLTHEVSVFLDASTRSGSDYGVTVNVASANEKAAVLASTVALWGVPGDPRHDRSRGWACLEEETGELEESSAEVAEEVLKAIGQVCSASSAVDPPSFLRLPTSCGAGLFSDVVVDSWSEPGAFLAPVAASGLSALVGCGSLPFAPSVSVTPGTRAASTPSGLTVHVHLPQDTTVSGSGLGEADVKDTTVALPVGVQVSASAADGLQACSEAQIGFQREDPASGILLFSPNPPACPEASKIANVTVTTPLLSHALQGFVYLAAQGANPFGSLVAVYLVVQDSVSGTLVKLAGRVSLDPVTGQIVTSFQNTPQLPFEDLTISFYDGPRAAVSTPQWCGTYVTEASLTPWSGEAPSRAPSSFEVLSGPGGSACANALAFSPSLTGGSTIVDAGRFTPFTVSVSHRDGDQALSGVKLQLPAGLLAMISSVTLCPEPAASEGTCGAESLIGHTVASVGLGSDPYTISGGQVFITGPYKGAPYGLSIAEPAKAGPFDLGRGRCDCIVVRAKIDVDPHTSAITVTTDPLPTILDGVPVQLERVEVTTDRPGFTFNPTDCNPQAVTASLVGEQGAVAPASVPFEVANCATLRFKPKFTVLTAAKTSKANGASLRVHVGSAPGQANIAKVKVDLPKQLPSRLTTLQKACPVASFEANPASCPAASVIGEATAVTPVLNVALKGPAYLVSHAGAAFPDLEIVLEGEGVTLVLDGQTHIKKGITSNAFRALPDAPVTSFDLTLPEGPHSALAANASLCARPLIMPTVLTGQNGAVVKQATRIAVSGCPKRRAKGARHARGAARR